MGWSLSWVAVQNVPAAEVQAAFGMKATGTLTGLAESPFTGSQLLDGWYVIAADHDFRFIEDATSALIARLGLTAVVCGVEEHSMNSTARAWRSGKPVWSVFHDGSGGKRGLEVQGEPPTVIEALKEAALLGYETTPTGVDFMFDVPVGVAEATTGFSHESTELEFEVLEAPETKAPERKGFFSKLFG